MQEKQIPASASIAFTTVNFDLGLGQDGKVIILSLTNSEPDNPAAVMNVQIHACYVPGKLVFEILKMLDFPWNY